MHHESETSEEMKQLLQELELGPTGRFPEGKLTGNDEGEIRFGVTVYKGKVVVNFGKPVASLGMLPEQARVLARTLQRRAKQAKIEAGEIRTGRYRPRRGKRKMRRR